MLQTVRLEPVPSRTALALLSCLHMASLVLIAVLDLALWMRLALTAGVICMAFLQLRSLGWLGGGLQVAALVCDPRGCRLRLNASELHDWQDSELASDYLVTRGVVVLNFRVAGIQKKVPVMLFPDSAPQDETRRLRALLRARRIPVMRSGSGLPVGTRSQAESVAVRR